MKDIVFTDKAWTDFIEWSKTDRKVFDKISTLIEETSRTPFKGTGKPEALRHKLKG
jgi:toxin YoeB